jgi:hypothetical protein
MRLLKQLVAVAAVAFVGSTGVHAVQGNRLVPLRRRATATLSQ